MKKYLPAILITFAIVGGVMYWLFAFPHADSSLSDVSSIPGDTSRERTSTSEGKTSDSTCLDSSNLPECSDIIAQKYRADSMLPANRSLFSEEGATVCGYTFTNTGITSLRITQLTLHSISQQSGQTLQMVFYGDTDSDGHFNGLCAGESRNQGLDELSLASIDIKTENSAKTHQVVFDAHSLTVPANDTVSIGIFLWNSGHTGPLSFSIQELLVQSDGDELQVVSVQDMEVNVVEMSNAPSEDYSLSYSAKEWQLLWRPEYHWTDFEETSMTGLEKGWPDTSSVEVRTESAVLHTLLDINSDNPSVMEVEPGIRWDIKEHDHLTASLIAQGESRAIHDTLLSCTLDLQPDHASYLIRRRLALPGTTFSVRIYPVVPGSWERPGYDFQSRKDLLPEAYLAPEGEKSSSRMSVSQFNSVTTRMSSPDASKVADNYKGTVGSMIEILEREQLLCTTSQSASCNIGGASFTLGCFSARLDTGTLIFEYKVTPVGSEKPPLLRISQFNEDGTSAGDAAIVSSSSIRFPHDFGRSNQEQSNVIKQHPRPILAEGIQGRDLSGLSPNPSQNWNRVVYLTPITERASPTREGRTDFFTELEGNVLFSVQKEKGKPGFPLATVHYRTLRFQTLALRFHFLGDETLYPATPSAIASTLTERASELLNQCGIKVQTSPAPSGKKGSFVDIKGEGIDPEQPLDLHSTTQKEAVFSSLHAAIPEAKNFHELNVFIFPQEIRGPGKSTVLGTTLVGRRENQWSEYRFIEGLGDEKDQRIILLSIGAELPSKSENGDYVENRAKAYYAGLGVLFSEVLAHKIGQAYGLSSRPSSSIEYVMREGLSEVDFSDPSTNLAVSRIYDPRYQRFTHEEALQIRENMVAQREHLLSLQER